METKQIDLSPVIYIDPKVVYDTNLKTTNLMLGFGLKF